jgi:hypothetical protein
MSGIVGMAKWHFLNFRPLPQGHRSFLPTFICLNLSSLNYAGGPDQVGSRPCRHPRTEHPHGPPTHSKSVRDCRYGLGTDKSASQLRCSASQPTLTASAHTAR